MKQLILGIALALASTMAFAQAEGGAAVGAGGAAGGAAVVTTNTILIGAGIAVAGMTAAGAKSETTTSH